MPTVARTVAAILFLSAVPSRLFAKDYFFSDCTAGGSGTQGDPYCMDPGNDGTNDLFGYLMDGSAPEAAAGDTIHLCAGACDGSGTGTMLQETGITTKVPGPITVQGYPGETVWIDGGERRNPAVTGEFVHVTSGDGSYGGYTFRNYNVEHFRGKFFHLGPNADNMVIENMEMRYLGELQEDIGIGDTAICGPAYAQNHYAVYIQDNGHNVSKFTFRNNKVHHICMFALRCNNHPTATDIRYEGNEFYNMSAVNNDFDCVHVTIKNNTIWDVVDAISVEDRSQYVVVEDNTIECRGVYNVHGNGGQRNCRIAIAISETDKPAYAGLIHDITIRRNKILGYRTSNEGSLFGGITWIATCLDTLGCTNINGVIENNFVHFVNPYFVGPTCCGRGGIDVVSNKGIVVRNNTVVQSMIGLQLDGTVAGVNHTVTNNLIINSQTYSGQQQQNVHVFNNAANSTFSNNNFWNALGNGVQVRYENGTSYDCSQLNLGNLGSGNKCVSPNLMNLSGAPDSWNLHLQATGNSGIVDSGGTSSAPSDDIDGQPRPPASTGLVDIGADEYVSDSTPPKEPTNLKVR